MVWCASHNSSIGHHLDSLTREQARLKHLVANQNYTPADIKRLNKEKMELQEKISSLSKAQEGAEKHALLEEMGLASNKERVRIIRALRVKSSACIELEGTKLKGITVSLVTGY